jgi:flagellar biosynthesis protein FlhF
MNATVRTFRAQDPRAALAAIRAALGDEAVILSTREVRTGLLGRAEIEVTASVGGNEPEPAPQPARRAPAPAHGHDLEGEVGALRRVVEDLRTELRATHGRREPVAADVSADALRLARRLVLRGVDDELAHNLAQQAARESRGRNERELTVAARQIVADRLPGARPPWEAAGRKLMAFIGPTGVGKTTTIAKIAARALLESHLRVALVTIDTYRIGATEHIGRYAEIMGVPVHEARDVTSFRKAMASTEQAELVLIDTAGRSDGDAMAAQVEILRSVPGVELNLVLSAASGARELGAAARRHRSFSPSRLCFTKLDEADGPGSVLSAATMGAPVACVCDGQRVPDDLHAATGTRLLDVVFGV